MCIVGYLPLHKCLSSRIVNQRQLNWRSFSVNLKSSLNFHPIFNDFGTSAKLLCSMAMLLVSYSLQASPAGNYQVSAYLGGTTSTIKVGDLSLIGETEQLNPQGSNQSNFTWGFGAAYRFLPPQVLRNNLLHELSLGLEFYAFKTTQSGDVWQYQLPEMNNFTYQLPIQSYRLLATNEITFHPIVPKAFPFFE